MDIPESGAVFTIGKSFLSDNHQSYFFIKNDAIRKLICGANQSGVICESGRLFVWGENQFGQLGTGSAEIVTKPSCVKTIKSLGYRVRSVAFGGTFGVILTENSKIFFSGQNIFNGTKYREKFWDLGNDVHVTRKPFEIEEFYNDCLDDLQGNKEQFVDVAAGDSHFVVLTSSGKLYGWGTNDSCQLGQQIDLDNPVQITEKEVVRVVCCGKNCTAFITRNNEMYITGSLNKLKYTTLTKININSFDDLMYSMYISKDNKIFLVINSGEIFESIENDGVGFRPFNMIHENIRKICTGNGFEAVVTESNKLLTTFNEKSSGKRNGYIRSPRELRKFNNLDILDAVSGLNHILVHAIPKSNSSYTSPDSTTDLNGSNDDIQNKMNDLNRTYTKVNASVDEVRNIQPKDNTEIEDNENNNNINQKSSKIPISEARKKSSISNGGSINDSRKNSEENATISELKEEIEQNVVAAAVAAVSISNDTMESSPMKGSIQKSLSLREFEKLEKENADHDVDTQSMENILEHDNNNNDGDERSPSVSSKGSQKSIRKFENVENCDNSNNENCDSSPIKNHSLENGNGIENLEKLENLKMEAEKPREDSLIENTEIQLEESDDTIEDMESSQKVSNNVAETVNGSDEVVESNHEGMNEETDVLKTTSNTDSAVSKNEQLECKNEDENEDDLTPEKIEDTLLGERLSASEEFRSMIFAKEETRKALEQKFEDAAILSEDTTKLTLSPPEKIPSENSTDDYGERTTASIASNGTNENSSENTNGDLIPIKESKVGTMSRFLKDIKSKSKGFSCTNSNAVIKDVNEDHLILSELERKENNKMSKICTIS